MASRQGRAERPINPNDGPLEAFAVRLRQLRKECGGPTYKEMARHAGYSSTPLSGAANGQAMPSLQVTLAYVRACLKCAKASSDRLEAAVQAWTSRWQELEAQIAPASLADSSTTQQGDTLTEGGQPTASSTSTNSAAAPLEESHAQGLQNAPTPHHLNVLRQRGGQVLAAVVALILLGVAVLIAKNIARPGTAEAGSGLPEHSPDGRHPSVSSPSTHGQDDVDQVQVDALGPESRCGPARSGNAGVLLRGCLRVEDERVLFALEISNPGEEAVEVTAKLSYVQAGQYYSCQSAEGLWHGTIPADGSHVTKPTDCVAQRTHAAYQADGLLAPGDSQNWTTHQLSPNAHVYPNRVLWRCKGDVPC
ncbi:helix-turn-helix domain-containing protein [Streptomyces atratus]|uniref:helix-turn-helix domain-containing protein n=1 Tax=Streptomyces atratus TaxID=1893 RepID=UPI0036BF886D